MRQLKPKCRPRKNALKWVAPIGCCREVASPASSNCAGIGIRASLKGGEQAARPSCRFESYRSELNRTLQSSSAAWLYARRTSRTVWNSGCATTLTDGPPAEAVKTVVSGASLGQNMGMWQSG